MKQHQRYNDLKHCKLKWIFGRVWENEKNLLHIWSNKMFVHIYIYTCICIEFVHLKWLMLLCGMVCGSWICILSRIYSSNWCDLIWNQCFWLIPNHTNSTIFVLVYMLWSASIWIWTIEVSTIEWISVWH